MMRLLRRTGTVLALLAELLACASALQAQLKSNVAAVNLNALLNSSLTVAAAPGLVNFALASNGVASGSSTITITTSWVLPANAGNVTDRKSTRLNSSHRCISYAVFCLKKKKNKNKK